MEFSTHRRAATAARTFGIGLGLALWPLVLGAAESEYHTRAEIDAALDGWARNHPKLVKVETIGKSAGGHALRVARFAGDGPANPEDRPGIFVGANIAGFHHAGSEAVLALGTALASHADGELGVLLSSHTFYLAPTLNPDAHDQPLNGLRFRRATNDQVVDEDVDGFEGEDGPEDLDGDGRITWVRIPDARGTHLPHPEEPRLMIEADPARGLIGQYRVYREGHDADGDGEWNEDPPGGVALDRNFAHAFPYAEPAAGRWPGSAPEVYALFEFFDAHKPIVLAVVYGPANNLLAAPRPLGDGGGELGTETFKLPETVAEFLGFDPEGEYTIDEVWEVARTQSFVRRNNITKAQLAQFIGVGPANKLEADDQTLLDKLSKDYKKRLEDAGLDIKRPAEQYGGGGLTPWLYYQFGAMAIELDVWGVPTPAEAESDEAKPALTVDALAEMSSEDFLALGEDTIAAFLKDIGVPPQITAEGIIQRVESGQVTPAQMAGMIRQMGAGGGGPAAPAEGEDSAEVKRQRAVLAWADVAAPDAFTPWAEVSLPDGTRAEIGGLDPLIDIAPPRALLDPAIAVHTEWIFDLASRLARLEIVDLKANDLGSGIYRVEAVGRNVGAWATHTQMAVRARNRLPVFLTLEVGDGAELVNGHATVTENRLPATGTITGEWLVRGRPGTSVSIVLDTAGAPRVRQQLVFGKEGR